MRAFDWERRNPPPGVVEIERTRRREFALQALNDANKTFKGDKMRSQWESSSIKKAELVTHTLASLSVNAHSNDADAHSSRQPRPDISEDIRAEETAKNQFREAEKAGAAQRRLALLNQAKALEAAKEQGKALALEQFKAESFQSNCPELRDLKSREIMKELALAWQQQLNDKKESLCKVAVAVTSENDKAGAKQTPLWPTEERPDGRRSENLQPDWHKQIENRATQRADEKVAREQRAADLRDEVKRADDEARQRKATRQEDQKHVSRQLDDALEWHKKESARRNAWQKEQEQGLMQYAEETWERAQAKEAQRRAERGAHAAKVAADVASWLKEKHCLEGRHLSSADPAAEEAKRDAQALEAAASRKIQQVEIQRFNDALLKTKRAQLEAQRHESLQERTEKESAAKACAAENEGRRAAKRADQAHFKASLGAQVASKTLQQVSQKAEEQERLAAAQAEEERWREAVLRARRQLNI